MLQLTLLQRASAEAIGTAFLLTAVVGSGIMAEQLAGGNSGLALLANTLATSAALVALISTFGALSGAHFNPWVTTLMWVRGAFDRREVPIYVLAQLSGAVAGVWFAHAMFDLTIWQVSTHTRTGLAQVIAESVATFGLLLVIGIGAHLRSSTLAISVAAYIAAAYWFTSSTSFANPAVTLARALTDTFAGIRPADVPGFLLGQMVGVVAAIGALRGLLPRGSAGSSS